MSAFTKINTIIWERFITCAAVYYLSSYYVFWFTGPNRWGKSLNLTNCMWILPETSFSERTKIVKSTFFIEMTLENKFIRSVVKISLSVNELLTMRLHWWNWTTWGFQMCSAESWIFSVGTRSYCFWKTVILGYWLWVVRIFDSTMELIMNFTTESIHKKLILKRLMTLSLVMKFSFIIIFEIGLFQSIRIKIRII